MSTNLNFLGVYSIYDELSFSYSSPFYDINDSCACRRVAAAYKNQPFDGLFLVGLGVFDMLHGNFIQDGLEDNSLLKVSISDLVRGSGNE